MYIKLYNDANLKHLQLIDIKLGVWGDDQIALLGQVQHLSGTPRYKEIN